MLELKLKYDTSKTKEGLLNDKNEIDNNVIRSIKTKLALL